MGSPEVMQKPFRLHWSPLVHGSFTSKGMQPTGSSASHAEQSQSGTVAGGIKQVPAVGERSSPQPFRLPGIPSMAGISANPNEHRFERFGI